MSEAYVDTFNKWKAMITVLGKEGGKEAGKDQDRGMIAALLVLAAELKQKNK